MQLNPRVSRVGVPFEEAGGPVALGSSWMQGWMGLVRQDKDKQCPSLFAESAGNAVVGSHALTDTKRERRRFRGGSSSEKHS